MGGKTTVVNEAQTTTRTLSEDEVAFNQRQLDLMDKQIQLIDQSNEFQQGQFEALGPLVDQYSQVLEAQVSDLNDPLTQDINRRAKALQLQQIQQATETLPIQKEILQQQLDEIKRGGAATPEQQTLIDEYTQSALESGTVDIDRYLDESLRTVRENLAPSRGLRPTDTPILEVADRATAEAVRQRGQLTSNLQAAAAAAKLNLPLAVSQLNNAIATGQQSINQGAQQFAANLGQTAAANRLQVSNLLGGAIGATGSSGISLASLPRATGFIQSGTTSSTGTRSATQRDPFGGLGTILSGAGALLKGAGAVGLFSSRAMKDIVGAADGSTILDMMRLLPVDRWYYKRGIPESDGALHVGPYAEDFRKLFGHGDGVTIPMIDAIGVLFAAVKELARRQETVNA